MRRRFDFSMGFAKATFVVGVGFVALVACDGNGLKKKAEEKSKQTQQVDVPVESVEPPAPEVCHYDIKGLAEHAACNIDSDCATGICGKLVLEVEIEVEEDTDGDPATPPVKTKQMVKVPRTFCTRGCQGITTKCDPGSVCRTDDNGKLACVPDKMPEHKNIPHRMPCAADEECTGFVDCSKELKTAIDCMNDGCGFFDFDCQDACAKPYWDCYEGSGKCVSYGDNIGFCAGPCASDADCKEACSRCDDTGSAGYGKMCTPKGGKKIGEECDENSIFECEAGICFLNKCTALCNTCKNQEKGEPCELVACPVGSKCAGVPSRNGEVEACFAESEFGSKQSGDNCELNHQCVDPEKCITVEKEGQYRRLCALVCEGTVDCPAGSVCAPAGGEENHCVPETDLGSKADGEPCSGHLDCTSLNCAEFGEETLCAKLCTADDECADLGSAFRCVGYSGWTGAPYMAAILADAAENTVGMDDSLFGGGGKRAQLRITTVIASAGKYSLLIMDELLLGLFGLMQEGPYVIKFESDLAPNIAPQPIFEKASFNDDLLGAQAIVAPVLVSGALSPSPEAGDVDMYTFNAVAGEPIDIKVTGPEQRACYARGDGLPGGAACTGDYACKAGLSCDLDIFACTQRCTSDASCASAGPGLVCKGVAGIRRCVLASTVAKIPTGEVCQTQLPYVCAGTNPDCLSVAGSFPFCSIACNPGACPGNMSCVNTADVGAAKNRCVLTGVLNQAAGAACTGNFQCTSGSCIAVDPERYWEKTCL